MNSFPFNDFFASLSERTQDLDLKPNTNDDLLYMRAFTEVNNRLETRKAKLRLSETLEKCNNCIIRYPVSLLHSKLYLGPEERRKLSASGVSIYTGRFDASEDSLIMKNLTSFAERHGVTDVNALFVSQARMKLFRTEHNLYLHLADGLNRTLSSVYARAKSLLLKYGNSEFEEYGIRRTPILLTSTSTVGTQTDFLIELDVQPKLEKSIGCPVGLSTKFKGLNERNNILENTSIQKKPQKLTNLRFRSRYKGNKTRKRKKPEELRWWTKEEELLLQKVLIRYVGRERLLIPMFNFPWKAVASCLPNKSTKQCQKHWRDALYWSYRNRMTLKGSTEYFALMIYSLHVNIVVKEENVDWNALFQLLQSNVPTYSRMRLHWEELKRSVPSHEDKSHREVVLYLYHKRLPKLLKKCNLTISDLQCKVNSMSSSWKYL